MIHYAPDDHSLCGIESLTAVFTDDPATVAGCVDCLELAAEDLEENNEHWADCLHCQQEISAQNGVEWRRVVRVPCPALRSEGVVNQKRTPCIPRATSRAGVEALSINPGNRSHTG